LPVICDSFRQGDGSETRSQGGVGIGLSLAKRLIEEMGGSLAVESEIGRGTTFSLLLPI
jgi:signal transduction histidine kinase